jgi:hypothetical protein
MDDDKYYEKDGKIFERGGGLFGTDKEVGSIERDVWGNEVTVKTPGIFTDNLECKRTDEGDLEVYKNTYSDELLDFRSGRDGFTIEKDWQNPHGQTSSTLHEAPWENDDNDNSSSSSGSRIDESDSHCGSSFMSIGSNHLRTNESLNHTNNRENTLSAKNNEVHRADHRADHRKNHR